MHAILFRVTLRQCRQPISHICPNLQQVRLFGPQAHTFSTCTRWQQQQHAAPAKESKGASISEDTTLDTRTRVSEALPSSPQSAGEAVCATTVPRPRLSPLPYLYLRNLPYNRSTDLQQLLVERQIQLRKDRKEQRAKTSPPPSSLSSSSAAVAEIQNMSVPLEDGSQDIILLVEHTPTFTNGRRNRGARSISDQEEARLKNLGATYVESLRGGEITFHGSGQLVAYPILDLKPIKLSVRCYVSYLEKAIIATCAQWGVKAMTTENTGVWIDDQKKIAAIGVHVQRYITSHGLALNCNTDLDFFKEIIACGLTGKETTSLAQELNNTEIDVQKVIPTFLKGFGTIFNRELVPLSTTNPDLEQRIHEFVQTGNTELLNGHKVNKTAL